MYETGSATGVTDLLDKLATFVEANGWTRDSLASDGTGKRYHAHKGSQYINFRSFVAETPNSGISGLNNSTTAITFNVGTGYSGASAWYNQAGVPVDGSAKPLTAGVGNIPGALVSYHFFAHNSGDQILAVIEWSAGKFGYVGFGQLAKIGTYTGGEYFMASHVGNNNVTNGVWYGTIGVNMCNAVAFIGGYIAYGNQSVGFVKADVDSETGWKHGDNQSLYYTPPTGRQVKSNHLDYTNLLGAQPNTLNSLGVFTPVVVSIYRDTNNSKSSSPLSVIGEIPKIFYVDVTNFTPKGQVAIGSTNYRVFPFIARNLNAQGLPGVTAVAGQTATDQHSGCWGFAVAE